MQTTIRLLFALSLVVNGALAGLIAGHMLAEPVGCKCGEDCECRRKLMRDEGPFPTGWVVPEPGPVKPSKPSGARP